MPPGWLFRFSDQLVPGSEHFSDHLEQQKAGSDLDLLVELDPKGSLLDLVAIKQDLEDLLSCPVDVVTERSLSPYLRERVLAEALPLSA